MLPFIYYLNFKELLSWYLLYFWTKTHKLLLWRKTYDSHACCSQLFLIQRNPSCMCQRSQFNNKGQTEGEKKTFSSSPKVICMTCQCKQGLIHFSHVINKMHVWAGNVTRWCDRVWCTLKATAEERAWWWCAHFTFLAVFTNPVSVYP